jgi:prepilin-type N-terminal cleavage/methylation domain-containing protein
MSNNKGFTLIELAVVLAIIAILAAVLTPIVMGYLDQARLARAQADVRTIADSLKLYNRDTGRWPIYNTSADFSSDTALGGKAELGTSIGTAPTSGAGWVLGASLATTALNNYVTPICRVSVQRLSREQVSAVPICLLLRPIHGVMSTF